jgi:putative membrane protein insertion efficiency factor
MKPIEGKPGEGETARSLAAGTAIGLYRVVLSPLLHSLSGVGGACRFQPTCSEYAAVALRRHGLLRGGLMALRRLAKCQPFHAPEFDPVPETRATKQSSSAPVTIEKPQYGVIPSAAARPRTATLPHNQR